MKGDVRIPYHKDPISLDTLTWHECPVHHSAERSRWRTEEFRLKSDIPSMAWKLGMPAVA